MIGLDTVAKFSESLLQVFFFLLFVAWLDHTGWGFFFFFAACALIFGIDH